MTFSHLTSAGIPFDLKLNDEVFHNKLNGFFIELGAFDGLSQSNTAFFEFEKQWKGILVEPSREKFLECVTNRPASKCFNAACSASNGELVAFDHSNGMMSKIVSSGSYVTTTLESILDCCSVTWNIDLLSLDVEGYELPVLKGLNLAKYRPNYMLIELWESNELDVKMFLESNNYMCVGNFSMYNTTLNPRWGTDGFHNDFLFKDNQIGDDAVKENL